MLQIMATKILNLLINQDQFQIDDECFKDCLKIKQITILSSVTSIVKKSI